MEVLYCFSSVLVFFGIWWKWYEKFSMLLLWMCCCSLNVFRLVLWVFGFY